MIASVGAIAPRVTDRAFIVGQTGSGKTTLAEKLCCTRRYVAALDPKRLLNWEKSGFVVFREFGKFCDAPARKVPRRIYRPSIEELNAGEVIDQWYEWVYRTGQWTVYTDEVALVTEGQTIPVYFRACLQQGREHGVESWNATQRPMNVPNVIMSEAEHVYTFRLKMEGDRDKVARMCQIEPELMLRLPDGRTLPKHVFYYAAQDADGALGPLRLTL